MYPVDSPQADTVPVARFWSNSAAHHFYTADAAERDAVLARWSSVWWHEGDKSYTHGPIANPRHARLSIFDRDGKVLARWGTPEATAPGSFAAPHGLAIDSKKNVYVSEVTWTFAVSRGRAPADCHTFQKFSLQS